MTDEERITEIANQAATKAVREAFFAFGVDTGQTGSVNKFQRDLNFLRDLRDGSELVKRRIVGAIVVAICTVLFAYIALTFKVHP